MCRALAVIASVLLLALELPAEALHLDSPRKRDLRTGRLAYRVYSGLACWQCRSCVVR